MDSHGKSDATRGGAKQEIMMRMIEIVQRGDLVQAIIAAMMEDVEEGETREDRDRAAWFSRLQMGSQGVDIILEGVRVVREAMTIEADAHE